MENEIHTHKIAKEKDGTRKMNDDGYYVCECGAVTFPNCEWFEAKNNNMENKIIKRFRDNIFEKLADIEHRRWCEWQEYIHSKLGAKIDYKDKRYFTFPIAEKIKWDRQIKTDYKDLSEREKDSDRAQVNRYFGLIEHFILSELKALKEECAGEEVLLHINESRGDNIGVEENWGNGYNKKREEIIKAFAKRGV